MNLETAAIAYALEAYLNSFDVPTLDCIAKYPHQVGIADLNSPKMFPLFFALQVKGYHVFREPSTVDICDGDGLFVRPDAVIFILPEFYDRIDERVHASKISANCVFSLSPVAGGIGPKNKRLRQIYLTNGITKSLSFRDINSAMSRYIDAGFKCPEHNSVEAKLDNSNA